MSQKPFRFGRFGAAAAVVLTLLAITAIAVSWMHVRHAQASSRAHRSPASATAGGRAIVATLYFARVSDSQIRLMPVARKLPSSAPPATAAMEELARGRVPTGCEPPLPSGTKALGVTVESGVAWANFSSELVRRFSGGSDNEEAVVYAIVNTLASLPGVRRVRILVQGRSVETIGGHIDISGALPPDNELVASQP